LKILYRYLGRTFLQNWLNVNLVLAGLFSFLELARQLDDVGKGHYKLSGALLYVALTLPGRMIEMAPPSALIGSILALGILDKNHELIALRACGISIQRVGWAFIRPAMVTLCLIVLGVQFVVPYLEQTAWTLRETAISVSGTILPKGGFWSRDRERFVNLRTARENGIQAADIYEFDRMRRLTGYAGAEETNIGRDGKWRLRDTQQKLLTENGSSTIKTPELVVPDLLTSKQAAALSLPPQTLSLTELSEISQNLKRRGENAGRYLLTLWQKLTLPLMTAAMIMISLPFVCGNPRAGTLGWHIMLGAIAGIGFFYLNQILGYAGLLLQLSPLWTTAFPALLVLAIGIFYTKKAV